jgi:predicted DNA-binding protein
MREDQIKPEKKFFNFRISESLADDLREVSDELEIPQSQIVREAVKEKVAALKDARVPQPVEATV